MMKRIGRGLAAIGSTAATTLAQEFAQQHPADQKRPDTLLIGMRS